MPGAGIVRLTLLSSGSVLGSSRDFSEARVAVTRRPLAQVDATNPGPQRQVFVVGVGATGSGDLAQDSNGAHQPWFRSRVSCRSYRGWGRFFC
jgi:hypothetical protein